jgi:hypothetical protein
LGKKWDGWKEIYLISLGEKKDGMWILDSA